MPGSSDLPDKPSTPDDFLRCVLRSGLLTREELQTTLRALPKESREATGLLADHLVRLGKLTRFQANKLLRGFSQGMIIGSYRLLAPLGKGGMGTVFLARDSRDERLVAIKILPPKLARSEERLVARFRREQVLNRKLDHPHLARSYEGGEFRGVPYLAMEYVPGKTLSRLVNEEGPLIPGRAARLMAEVASALGHAHERGIIHRDLKPSNILITPRDQAKVLDLGLALTFGETADTAIVGGQGYILGTMDYIAPEQTYDAAGVDGRSDLYSLGCTLYFALSGQPPFPGGTSKEKIQRHRLELPKPLGELAMVPDGFLELIDRLMAKDPSKRIATADEAEMLLREWATGQAGKEPKDGIEPGLSETMILRDAAASTEYSLVNLPPVEELPEVEILDGKLYSPSLGVILIVGVGLLGVFLTLLAILLFVLRR